MENPHFLCLAHWAARQNAIYRYQVGHMFNAYISATYLRQLVRCCDIMCSSKANTELTSRYRRQHKIQLLTLFKIIMLMFY